MGTSSIRAENAANAELIEDLLQTLKDFIKRRRITHEQYRKAVAFFVETGKKGEIPLMMDVFLEVTVVDVSHAGEPGTESCIEGPYYVPDAPMLESPCVMPMRSNEPGEPMIFSGTVRSTDGSAVAGVLIDLWQSNGAGQYSHFDYQEPRYNLRGRLRTDANGRFEVKTVKPSPYEIPKNGPTEALLAILGSHAFRPAHLHMKLSHDGFEPMTTQLFIAGDPYIDSDCVKAVKPSLVIEPRPVTQGGVRHLVASYDFVLRPGAARRAA